MAQDYLKPKVASPKMLRDKKNGQFHNPPLYIDRWGGFTSARGLNRLPGDAGEGKMNLEKGGPQAKRGKPI